MILTFAICTFNRAEFLPYCIQSIISQSGQTSVFEILVINNNSTDNTSEIVTDFIKNYPNIRLVHETKQGLSYARNRAIQEAKGEWLVYIDDDAKIREGYLKRILWIIDNYNFDCIGGMYYAWHLYGKPDWLPLGFGDKKLLRSDVGSIDGSRGWLSGGNIAIKKPVLEKVNGFNPDFGMAGNTIAYGEENDLQRKILDHGYKIGFDPDLIIDHAVLPHKLQISWHLKNSYAMGKYAQALNNQGTIFQMIYWLLKSSLGAIFKHLPISIFKWGTRKDYYFQNLLLDCFKPALWFLGVFINKIKNG